MNESKDKAIRRLKKLMALTSSSNANEASAALARMLTMHEMVMNKTNIKASFCDTDCIREMNEAPIQARRVLLDIKGGAA
ncbi:hypothetical protein SFE98_002819 [Salmonella enterica]|nr:hypothetical protein [Salmonella enterica]ELV0513184.1 hypothetical protein [Salmonella enterica]ELZ3469903.1 hypothetical protein [Salmonella enterica]